MGRRALRRISDPVIAALPAGMRIRTRIHVTDAEAAALTSIGEHLGELYRAELADRVRHGHLDRVARLAWRVEHKRALTAVSSSRWGGAITRAVEDQYQLGLRGLAAHVSDLRVAVGVLEERRAAAGRSCREAPHPREPTSPRLPHGGGTILQDAAVGRAAAPSCLGGASAVSRAAIDGHGRKTVVAHAEQPRSGRDDSSAVEASVGLKPNVPYR